MFTISATNHSATTTAATFTEAASTAFALYGECFLVSESNGRLVFQVGPVSFGCDCGDCDECDN